jgi:hypothetical protein
MSRGDEMLDRLIVCIGKKGNSINDTRDIYHNKLVINTGGIGPHGEKTSINMTRMAGTTERLWILGDTFQDIDSSKMKSISTVDTLEVKRHNCKTTVIGIKKEDQSKVFLLLSHSR